LFSSFFFLICNSFQVQAAFGIGGTAAASKYMYDGVGPTAVLLMPGAEGNLVHVVAAEHALDWSAVSAALDTDVYFVVGDAAETQPNVLASRHTPSQRLCWHAARVHHHCRTMAAQEVPCEQHGSHMSKTWVQMGKNQNFNPADFMDTVLTQKKTDGMCRQ
jgi:hypothetical protein